MTNSAWAEVTITESLRSRPPTAGRARRAPRRPARQKAAARNRGTRAIRTVTARDASNSSWKSHRGTKSHGAGAGGGSNRRLGWLEVPEQGRVNVSELKPWTRLCTHRIEGDGFCRELGVAHEMVHSSPALIGRVARMT